MPRRILRSPALLALVAVSVLVVCAIVLGTAFPASVHATNDQPARAPSNLSASSNSCAVNLTWDAPTEEAATVTGYQVLRALGEGESTVLVSDTGSTDAGHSDSTAQRGQTYTYSVKALRGTESSAASNEAEVGVPATPSPTAVTVSSVPIVVESTIADYFVLYVTHDPDDDNTVEYPVAVTLGKTGTTTLSENIEALPKGHYRVVKYQVSNPADVDGDCIDDMTELNNLGAMSPVNGGGPISLSDGSVAIADHTTFESYAYLHPDRNWDRST